MSGTILDISPIKTQLVIDRADRNQLVFSNDSGTLNIIRNNTVLEVSTKAVKLLSIGMQGPQGIQGPAGVAGPPGPPGGGLMAVEDDPNPTLGGDLILGPYNIIGQLENITLVLDGGLL